MPAYLDSKAAEDHNLANMTGVTTGFCEKFYLKQLKDVTEKAIQLTLFIYDTQTMETTRKRLCDLGKRATRLVHENYMLKATLVVLRLNDGRSPHSNAVNHALPATPVSSQGLPQ